MSVRFISCLGTSRYEKVEYQLEEKRWSSMYIQEALINMLGESEWKVHVLMTEAAKTTHWDDTENNAMQGLGRRLEGIVSSVEPMLYQEKEDSLSMWQILNLLYEAVQEGDELIIDITHSFRTDSMVMLVAVDYLTVLKNVKVRGIYYGAVEAEKDDLCPVFDLTYFWELTRWSRAAGEFTNLGKAEMLQNRVGDIKGMMFRKEESREEARSISESNIENYAKNIQMFIDELKIGHGNSASKKKNIHDAAKNAQAIYQSIDFSKLQGNKMLPFIRMFPVIQKEVTPFAESKEGDEIATGLLTMMWCKKHNMIQLGITVLSETILTMQECERRNTDVKISASDELEKIKQEVKIYRNDVNHFGYSKVPHNVSEFKEVFERNLEKIIQMVQEYPEIYQGRRGENA